MTTPTTFRLPLETPFPDRDFAESSESWDPARDRPYVTPWLDVGHAAVHVTFALEDWALFEAAGAEAETCGAGVVAEILEEWIRGLRARVETGDLRPAREEVHRGC